MKIDYYKFGRIVIDGREYTHDVIITGCNVIDNWGRMRGHKLQGGICKVVGTGYSGCMEVPAETRGFIESMGGGAYNG